MLPQMAGHLKTLLPLVLGRTAGVSISDRWILRERREILNDVSLPPSLVFDHV